MTGFVPAHSLPPLVNVTIVQKGTESNKILSQVPTFPHLKKIFFHACSPAGEISHHILLGKGNCDRQG